MSADDYSNIPSKPGRPAGTPDTKPRHRRTKAEIMDAGRVRQSGQDALNGNDGREADPMGRNVDLSKISALLRGEPDQDGADRSESTGGSRKPLQDPAADEDDEQDQAGERDSGRRPGLELDDDDEGEKRRKPRAKSLDEFAEEHGVKAKDLYSVLIETGIEGDDPKSLGELKDHYRESRDLEDRRDDFEEHHSRAMNEIHTARQQINGVMFKLAQHIAPEQLAEIFAEEQASAVNRLKEARAQVLEFFPEWRDGDKLRADREALTELLGTYGFSARLKWPIFRTHAWQNLPRTRGA